MKLAGLFLTGILLMIAGMRGNLGSMLGSVLDPANMVDLGGGSSNTSSPTTTDVSQILGGTGKQFL